MSSALSQHDAPVPPPPEAVPDAPANPNPITPNVPPTTQANAPCGARLLALALVFGKFGGITFGGGYAIVALLEEELVEKRHWLTSEELLDILTVGESTPGPIAVNTATFVGYRLAGVWGGLIATLALVFPAWLVIVLISSCYLAFRENVWVAAALAGVRVAAIVLIARAFLRMGHGVKPTAANLLAGALAFGLVAFTSIHAIWVVLGGLLFGVAWYGVRPRLRGGAQ